MKRTIALAVLMLASTPLAASAGITWSATPGMGTAPAAINFDGPLPPGVTLSFTGDGGLHTGSSATFAAPYGDTTQYASSGIGSARLDFGTPQQGAEFDLSSDDNYNLFQFYNGGTLVGSLSGGQIDPSANGDRGPGGTFHVDVTADQPWNTMIASATQYATEFDNVNTQPAASVSEPASLVLLGFGLLGMAAMTRKPAARRAVAHG